MKLFEVYTRRNHKIYSILGLKIKIRIKPKIYYVISNPFLPVGLFALWKHVISHVMFAQENGFIPVVDLKHYRNQFFKDGREYQDNIWEYYFEQPAGVSLEKLKNKTVKIAPLTIWAGKKYEIYPPPTYPLRALFRNLTVFYSTQPRPILCGSPEI